MKTNQIMIRQMGDFKVEQRTKDGFFNATLLLKQWNINSNQQKQISHYTDNITTKEYINALITEEDLKERNSVLLQVRGKNGGTWMHPLLFIDFAMWLNPSFKIKVLKFVRDKLMEFRHLAGDSYPTMCKAVRRLFADNDTFKEKIQDLARSLNIIVYGKHEHEMRNKVADESKVRELYELQLKVAEWIEMGFVNTMEELRNALNKMYYQKYPVTLPI